MPKVSIIVPVFNAAATLERCVGSLAAQLFDDVEVIFVEDASTDGSLNKLKSLLKSLPALAGKTRIIAHETNLGCAVTRRDGMQAARGQYMIHVDADDWVEPEFVLSLYEHAMATDADIVICNAERLLPNGKKRLIEAQKCDTIDGYLCRALSGEIHNCLWNKLIRTEIIHQKKIYPIDGLSMYEDKMVVVNLLSQAEVKKVSLVQRVLYHYDNRRFGSITNKIRGKSEEIKAARTYIDWVENNIRLSEAAQAAHRQFKLAVTALQIRLSQSKGEFVLPLKNVAYGEIWSSTTLPLHNKLLLILAKLFY